MHAAMLISQQFRQIYTFEAQKTIIKLLAGVNLVHATKGLEVHGCRCGEGMSPPYIVEQKSNIYNIA